jgi:hypothetical protein
MKDKTEKLESEALLGETVQLCEALLIASDCVTKKYVVEYSNVSKMLVNGVFLYLLKKLYLQRKGSYWTLTKTGSAYLISLHKSLAKYSPEETDLMTKENLENVLNEITNNKLLLEYFYYNHYFKIKDYMVLTKKSYKEIDDVLTTLIIYGYMVRESAKPSKAKKFTNFLRLNMEEQGMEELEDSELL